MDTSVYVEVLRDNRSIQDRVDQLDTVLVCPVVEGELLYGAECSARAEADAATVLDMMSLGLRIVIDGAVAASYARIKAQLRRCGTPIPDNDIWVAACAIAQGATLVSRDRHFAQIDGLAQEEW